MFYINKITNKMFYEITGLCLTTIAFFYGKKIVSTTKSLFQLTQIVKGDTSLSKIFSVFVILSERYKFKHEQEVFTHKHERVGKYHYLIEYDFDGNEYKILVKKRRGPNKISSIINEEGVDVIESIRTYLGPSEDFHGTIYKPEFFKMRTMTFIMNNGIEHTFINDEDIILNI